MPVPYHMAVELKSVRLTDIVGWLGLCQWQFCTPPPQGASGNVWRCLLSSASEVGEVAASLSSG